MKAVMVRCRWGAALAALVAALLVFAAGAAAAPKPGAQGIPLWFWEVDKVTQGGGTQWVQKGSQLGGHLGGPLHKAVRLGRVVFNLPLPDPYWTSLPRNDAFGGMFASADGAQYSVLAQSPSPNPLRSGVSKGTISHLDEYQAYQKTSSDASLTSDDLGPVPAGGRRQPGKLGAWECPPAGNCEPMRAVVRFHARAYAASDRRRLLRRRRRRVSRRACRTPGGPGGRPRRCIPGAVGTRTSSTSTVTLDDSSTCCGRRECSMKPPRSVKVPLDVRSARRAVRRPRHPRGRGGQRSRWRVRRPGVHPRSAGSRAAAADGARPEAARQAAVPRADAEAAAGGALPGGAAPRGQRSSSSDAGFIAERGIPRRRWSSSPAPADRAAAAASP